MAMSSLIFHLLVSCSWFSYQLICLLHEFRNLERFCNNVVLIWISSRTIIEFRIITIPASRACSICSILVFAVTAIIGTGPIIFPSLSKSRIRRAHAKPSIIGISRSINMIDNSIRGPFAVLSFQSVVLERKSRASLPIWIQRCVLPKGEDDMGTPAIVRRNPCCIQHISQIEIYLPWFATWTTHPAVRNCLLRTFWFIKLSSTSKIW